MSLLKITLLCVLFASTASAISITSFFSGSNGSANSSTPIYVGQLSTFGISTIIASGDGTSPFTGPAYPPTCGALCSSFVIGSVSFGGFTAVGGAQIDCGGAGSGCFYNFYPLYPPSTQITLPAGVYFANLAIGAICPGCGIATNYVQLDLTVISGSASTTPEPMTWVLIAIPLSGILWNHRYRKGRQRQG